ncbi:MAG: SDR family oxidoreductase [Candidatus Rokubacteria bacterium]|nr:SDR family oxidoreductase [Candidatus Rokubacteria bacterium]
MLIQGKVGLITGAASGMGRAASLMFAREGARLACADLNLAGVERVASDIAGAGGEAIPCPLDIASRTSARAAVERTVRRFGRLDFLVNYAGVWDGRNIADIEDEHWDRVLDVNLKGAFLICQAATPVMIEQRYGRIVLIGSIAARVGGEMGGPHYAASKGGVISLGRALARRLGKYNITVNTINPGPVESEMTAGWSAEAKMAMARMTPLGRIGVPDDIVSATLFLVSDLSGWLTGETLEVNGGIYFG